ncbi:peptidoglycan-associated lipoprotein Pal [Aestuariivirga sp.]|uniref:peptidoglycan-associated lipoprotein Pal n=1 Tax=Aestuariivirga sp. TaxID=2650926 RepID=UPI0039E3A0A7
MKSSVSFKIAVAFCCALSLAACSKKTTANLDDPSSHSSVIPGSAQDLALNAGDRVFFAQDQTTLSPDAQETLRKQAAWLSKYSDVAIQIEGHADERGTREYNISLSARRATVTRDFLIAQGIDAKRISSIAYGKERPVALCDAEQCWSQNRRAVTVITSGARTS